MQLISRAGSVGLLLVTAVALIAGGCTQGDAKKVQKGGDEAAVKIAKGGDSATSHDTWWCAEHGIPEGECSMCSKKVADAFKAKGDWCELHNRAKSQCFICDSKLKEVFAAKYRAKYGKEPPPIEED